MSKQPNQYSNKLTEKQELFCQKYIENSGNASKAYIEAYNYTQWKEASINVAASQLMANDKIKIRINELRQIAQEKHGVNIEYLTKEAQDLISKARDGVESETKGAFTAWAKGIEILGKLYGLFIEKREIKQTSSVDGKIIEEVLKQKYEKSNQQK